MFTRNWSAEVAKAILSVYYLMSATISKHMFNNALYRLPISRSVGIVLQVSFTQKTSEICRFEISGLLYKDFDHRLTRITQFEVT